MFFIWDEMNLNTNSTGHMRDTKNYLKSVHSSNKNFFFLKSQSEYFIWRHTKRLSTMFFSIHFNWRTILFRNQFENIQWRRNKKCIWNHFFFLPCVCVCLFFILKHLCSSFIFIVSGWWVKMNIILKCILWWCVKYCVVRCVFKENKEMKEYSISLCAIEKTTGFCFKSFCATLSYFTEKGLQFFRMQFWSNYFDSIANNFFHFYVSPIHFARYLGSILFFSESHIKRNCIFQKIISKIEIKGSVSRKA